MTSLPVWEENGDDTDSVLGASNFRYLSYHSFHLIQILHAILFLTWFQFKWYIKDHMPIKWPPGVAEMKKEIAEKKAFRFITSYTVNSLT